MHCIDVFLLKPKTTKLKYRIYEIYVLFTLTQHKADKSEVVKILLTEA